MKLNLLAISLLALAPIAACSSETDTNTSADTGSPDPGCNLFTGVGCEDTGGSDTGGGAADTGGSDTGGGTDTGATDTGATDTGSAAERNAIAAEVRALCIAQRRHICKLATDCESLAEIRAVFEQLGGIDTASCAEAIAGLITPDCELIAAGIERGRVTVDRAGIASCMPELSSEDCDSQVSGSLPLETGCTNGVVGASGLQPDGVSCAAHVECSNGLRCTSNGVEDVEGLCEPAELADCTTLSECPQAFYCIGVSSSIDGVGSCTARLGEGARCSDPDACLAPFACLRLDETDPATGQPYVATCGRLTP